MSTTVEHRQVLINVKNFSKYVSEELLEADLVGENDLGLKVKIYPCSEEFVSIFIARETAEKPFSVEELTCNLTVTDSEGAQRFLQSFAFYNKTEEDVFIFGLKQCFNRAGLLDLSEELLLDDVLSLQFDLVCKGKRVSKSILNTGKALRELAESFRSEQQFRKNNIQRILELSAIVPNLLKSVPSVIGEYFNNFLHFNEEWVTIETMHGIQHYIRFKEGVETLGSKLCAASPVFSSILKSPMQEKEDKKIKIIDFDAATFSAFLRFIGSGQINWDDMELEDVYSLYQMSDKYEVLDLMRECSQYLAQNINTENVIDIAKLATMHCDSQLKMAVASFCNAEETWFIGKINPIVLSEVTEKVKLKSRVPGNFTANEKIDHSNLQTNQVVLLRTFEDAWILYGIADELEVHDMMMKCAQYMERNISQENATNLLTYIKQYHNCLPLSFVKTFLVKNLNQRVEEAFGTSSTKGLSLANSEESLYFSCDQDSDTCEF